MEIQLRQAKKSPMSSAIANGFARGQIYISVSHRLRLEIVIDEDSFAQRTETLVHRKSVRRVLGQRILIRECRMNASSIRCMNVWELYGPFPYAYRTQWHSIRL